MTDLSRLAELGRPVKKTRKYETFHTCDTFYDTAAELRMADAALAERMASEAELLEQATSLLDAIFQIVDGEDGEEIVLEAFPAGAPEWVLAWCREHPTEDEEATDAPR